MIRRPLLLLVVLAAACGGEDAEPEKPVDPALLVQAEDGTELRGSMTVISIPGGGRNLVDLDLQAAVPASEDVPMPETSWTLSAKVVRSELLAKRHLELDWPADATYRSTYGASPKGSVVLDFVDGRVTGVATSENGGEATFAGDVNVLCEIGRDKFDEPIYDPELEDPGCSPLKPLLR